MIRAYIFYLARSREHDPGANLHAKKGARMDKKSEFIRILDELYGGGNDTTEAQVARYRGLLDRYRAAFNTDNDIHLFSSPGRAELSGNHTDHNGGMVLAASITLDSVAAVSRTDSGVITLDSEGFPAPFVVDTADLEKKENEHETTAGLIRGISACFRERGRTIGGFNATVTSSVGIGSGLSSSASIEVLLGSVLNELYNGGRISPMEIALAGQYAENVYFNKPSGLMDQIASAYGGIVSIDFQDLLSPAVERVSFDFTASGYSLLVVETGDDHADLTDDYASIFQEMKAVAGKLGVETCREIDMAGLLDNIPVLRGELSDRALLRAYHFISENSRVRMQTEALKRGDLNGFIKLVSESGLSSALYLQNTYSTRRPERQGIQAAYALTDRFIKERGIEGGFRVHGGGFGGTVLVILPVKAVGEYIRFMESAFGSGCALTLRIRSRGAFCLGRSSLSDLS